MSGDFDMEALLKVLSDDAQKKPYLIAKNVITRFELFPGFGWFEILSIIGGAGLGIVVGFIFGLVIESFFRYIFFAFMFAGIAFFLFKPLPDGQSFYKMFTAFRKWSMRKKRYLYVGRDR